MEILPRSSLNFQGCVLWLDAASGRIPHETHIVMCGAAKIVVTPDLPYCCRIVHTFLSGECPRLAAERKEVTAGGHSL